MAQQRRPGMAQGTPSWLPVLADRACNVVPERLPLYVELFMSNMRA